MAELEKGQIPSKGVEETEMQQFQAKQRTLALVAYVRSHQLAISPIDFVKRDDKVAHKVRHDAGLEWVAESAELFRRHWETPPGKTEILALDTNDEQACVAFLEKLEQLRKKASGE